MIAELTMVNAECNLNTKEVLPVIRKYWPLIKKYLKSHMNYH